MVYAVLGLVVLVSLAVGLYCFLKKNELETLVSALCTQAEEQEVAHDAEAEILKARLARLDKFAHIPDVLDRAWQTERQAAARLEQAQARVHELLAAATQEAERTKVGLLARVEEDAAKAGEARRVAEWQANNVVEAARKEAREIAAKARKEAREKTQKVEEILSLATAYARRIRGEAERRAEEIAGSAYEALRQHDHYRAAAQAMQNVMGGYKDIYAVPAAHILDELADEYAFDRIGKELKLARQRTRIMLENGLAAACDYAEGWKRDYAIEFVLGAFNGKVDAILARVKPAQQGRLIQEIKDAYALVNHNGEVFKNARIREEYLDARLEELRWAVAVQQLKERHREEQRAIRERIREEEKARKEYERALKQAEKEEDLIARALEKARGEFERAGEQEKAAYEARLRELDDKLREVEERNRRALSMAQQTRCGHVYIISNVGSFGEGVYKIGLTRRLEPTDRVRELGDASVPFAFDVHAMIYSEDAPALEASLHRHFVTAQVNKVNKRKEFFRVGLQEIRQAVEGLGLEARWTIAAEAAEYRETLALEQAMRSDAELARQWAEEQAAYEPVEDTDADEEATEELDAGAMA